MAENNIWTVYEHISPSGKVYVGITSRKPKYRWNHGKGYTYKDDQKAFKAAILKYGWTNFQHNIVASHLGERTAKNIEKDLIAFNKKKRISYNMTEGGDGVLGCHKPAGYTLSEETKKKMSITRKGTNQGINNPMYGRHETSPTFGKFGKEHPASKSVYQYTLDGSFVKKYDSITEAAVALGNATWCTHITACAKRKQDTALGYQWRYKKEEKVPSVIKIIYQYLPFSRRQLRKFKSLKEVADLYNINTSQISSCLNHKLETAFGFIWSYTDYEIFPKELSNRSKIRLMKYTKPNSKYYNEELQLDRERLEFDKQKAKTDAEIKRMKAKK